MNMASQEVRTESLGLTFHWQGVVVRGHPDDAWVTFVGAGI